MTSDAFRLGYRPAFDGLRTVAVGLVLVSHTHSDGGAAGGVGVATFFTLSGFLITSLLLEEHATTGKIELGRFWLRRAARLVPALLVTVAVALLLQITYRGEIGQPVFVLAALTYTTNYANLLLGSGEYTFLGHTWSLGVEEQFYVLWPLLMLALVRLPRRWVFVLLAYAVTAGVAATLTAEGWRAVWGLDCRAGGLLIGCALAWVMHRRPTFEAPRWLLWIGVAMLGLLAFIYTKQPFAWQAMPNVVAVATCAVIMVVVTRGSRPLEWAPLVWVGRRSYGVYLYQPAALFVAHSTGLPWLVATVLGVAVTLAAAAASFRWVEEPIRLRVKRGSGRVDLEDCRAKEASGGAVVAVPNPA